MNQFIEYAAYDVKNRSNFDTIDIIKRVGELSLSKGVPWYTGIWLLDDSVKELKRLRQTIKSYKGSYMLPRVILDVDRGTNSDVFVFDQLRRLVNEMLDQYDWFENNHQVWYSGTGYHIIIPDVFGFPVGDDTPEIVKATMKAIFPWCDQACFTKSSIVRGPCGFNAKSDRYKTRIPTMELLSQGYDMEEVIHSASMKPTRFEWYPDFPDAGTPLNDKIVMPQRIFSTAITPSAASAAQRDSGNIVTCMQKCFLLGEQQGSRHQRILRLASWMRRQGIPQLGAVMAMVGYAPSLQQVEIERIVAGVYANGYHYGCDDPIMKEFCETKCVFYKGKDYNRGITSAQSAEKMYADHVRNVLTSDAVNLRAYYNMPHDYKIFPGELVTVIGDTKLGKSAWVQNLMQIVAPKRVIYLPLENGIRLSYRRSLQIAHGMKKDDINAHYRTNNDTLSEAVGHILLSEESPKLTDIIKMITDHQPKLVVIDTLDMVDAGTHDPMEQVDVCAKALKTIANKLQTSIIVVHHVTKGAAIDEDGFQKKMTIHSGKYATTLQQKSDKVIAVEGIREHNRRTVRSLGARDENGFTLQFDVDFDTFRFNQVST